MNDNVNNSARASVSRMRHYGGFIAAGLLALCIDAVVLMALTEMFGWSPYVARLLSISMAMVASWQVNRRVTFAVERPSTVAEFARFAAVSWGAQAVNYLVFAGLLLLRPETWPVAALVVASLIAMFVSYAGFRFGVFAKS